MQANDRITRQGMGCGYEPPAPRGVRVMPWQPPPGSKGFAHERPTVCAGYTTSLPEVLEATKARVHWKMGQLGEYLGERAQPELLDSVLILEAEVNSVDVWRITPAKDGGGGP